MHYDSLEETAYATGMTDVEYDEQKEVLGEIARREEIYRKMKKQALYAQITKASMRHGKKGISTVRASRIRSEIGSMVQELERRTPTPQSEWEQMHEDLK